MLHLHLEFDENFLQPIVTVDELRIHHYDQESPEQTRSWKRTESLRPVRSSMKPRTEKILTTMFWDAKAIVPIHYLKQNSTT
ncbi:hypothetical protein M514_19050 [Trichuris suis]|uniref:Uncharacterized protein n=1 Tax=Trichuris suis TaxID=68888 RepID=A0A085NH63_9BILA|nr:hypothetical protein M514_19050 [Trichuris suis]